MEYAASVALPLPAASPFFSYMTLFGITPVHQALHHWYKDNRWDAKQLMGSGLQGMPPLQSATVT